MTGHERCLAAFGFHEPDRVPRFWNHFWDEFAEEFQKRFPGIAPMAYFGNDMDVVVADETPWLTRARVIRESGGERLVRDGWGRTSRVRTGASFSQTIEVALPERVDPDTLVFDDPRMDSRYVPHFDGDCQRDFFLLCKTGGPYLRTAFLRGEEQFWIDVKEDPGWVRALVDRVVDHLIVIGVESIRRWNMQDTGIEINDDVAASWGPFVGPNAYETLFLPALKRMVKAYKAAGARYVMHHADGNVLPLLDMWVDAGVDAINPVEYRSGMDAVKLRERYGRNLVLVGGLDNCDILPRGDRAEVREHVLRLLEAGLGGGFVIGPHSIGPDIRVETMLYVLELIEEHGRYPLRNNGADRTLPERIGCWRPEDTRTTEGEPA